jgi:hypothetical protein
VAIKPLNQKGEQLIGRPPEDVRPYAFGDCCPGFLPGWEVGSPSQGATIDPCSGGWQADLPLCHPCYWSAQVPDSTTWPNWFRDENGEAHCQNIAQDWVNLCTVPD